MFERIRDEAEQVAQTFANGASESLLIMPGNIRASIVGAAAVIDLVKMETGSKKAEPVEPDLNDEIY